MAKVFFTSNLRRHVDCAAMEADGGTVREVLAVVFAAQDRLGHYVLDDQGHVRPNVAIFIDGRRCADAATQTDALQPDSRVYVMQALSGG